MVNDAQNVVAGKPLATGGVLIGPLDAPAPTGVDDELDTDFVAAGYIGEDGLTEGGERSTDKVRAWGGDTVKVLQTDFSVTYQFTFLESVNATVLQAVYGDDNVTTDGDLHEVIVNAETLPHKSFVFEVKDGDARIRIYVPDGQVTEVSEITYSDSEVVGYQVTVEAFRAPAINGNAKKFLTRGATPGS